VEGEDSGGGTESGCREITLLKTRKGVRWVEEFSGLPVSSSWANSACSTSFGRTTGFLCRRRRNHKSNKATVTTTKPKPPAAMPPITPALNLEQKLKRLRNAEGDIVAHEDEGWDVGVGVGVGPSDV
jgi:hypothetical protein